MTGSHLLSLLGPAISAIFGLTFLCIWRFYYRQGAYLLYLAYAYLATALAICMQYYFWPADVGLNLLSTGLLYTSAVLALTEGCLRRVGLTPRRLLHAGIGLLVLLLLAYFYYVDRQLVLRVYTQNLGYGLLLLLCAIQLGQQNSTRPVDRIHYVIILLFGLQFFIRTPITLAMTPTAPDEILLQNFRQTPFWLLQQWTLILFFVLVAISLIAATVAAMFERLREERDTDTLTGMRNRRGLESAAASLLHAAHDAQPLCLLLCDLDFFKRVNDSYGHAVGDQVLRQFGALLSREVRGHDVAGRLGGEEFVVLLPATERSQARRLAERMQARLAVTQFSGLRSDQRLTASFGIAQHRPGETLPQLLLRADQRLYAAKGAGRDQIVEAE